MSDIMDNPYYSTSALHNTNMFFGRMLLLRRIYSALANRQSISLVGLRHMGKSSLLHCLRQPELLRQFEYDFSRCIFVPIDLREYRDKNSEDFFAAVSRQIILQSQGRLQKLSQEHGNEHEFSSLLDQISEQKFHTILLMDAFDNVTRNSNFDLSFFSYLRSQATLGKVSYVTATIAPLNKVCHSSIEESPFFNIFARHILQPLAPDDAYALATQPAMQAGLSFTEQEVACALDLSGYHPFFIQRVCYVLFEEKYRLHGAQIDCDHLTALAYAELEPYFDSIWERLEREQQEVLKNQVLFKSSSNVEIPELSESSLFRRFVFEKFAQQRYTPTLEAVEEALDKLQNPSVLGETDLQHLRIVSLRAKHATSTPAEKGMAIREVLTEAFEHLRGSGYRNDTEPAWRAYNILYYRFFKHHLKNDMIVARMDFTSSRQFFRERKKAIEAFYHVLLEMEDNPTKANKM
jgi:AAA-like domain